MMDHQSQALQGAYQLTMQPDQSLRAGHREVSTGSLRHVARLRTAYHQLEQPEANLNEKGAIGQMTRLPLLTRSCWR
jgi:ribose 1,5-bisphosphokinase PhnN